MAVAVPCHAEIDEPFVSGDPQFDAGLQRVGMRVLDRNLDGVRGQLLVQELAQRLIVQGFGKPSIGSRLRLVGWDRGFLPATELDELAEVPVGAPALPIQLTS
jgi:hypothetical protein